LLAFLLDSIVRSVVNDRAECCGPAGQLHKAFGGKGGQTMRSYWLFVVGLLALLLYRQSVVAQILPASENKSVKLRLEIEIRGLLSVTDKAATITNKETVYEYQPNLGLQSRQEDKVWVLELDENLKKIAKALHGKEIEVTGKCLVLGVKSWADTAKTPAPVGTGPTGLPQVVPERIVTNVASQLLLDSQVTVISLKAAK
jgi:hypothetical protein